MAISIQQARQRPDVVRRSLSVDGATIELCAFPEVRAETVRVAEAESILMLGLSPLLSNSVGRMAGDPRRPYVRFGALALRPAGVPLEITLGQGVFDTIRIRFSQHRIAPALSGICLDNAVLTACLDMRAPMIEDAMLRMSAELERPVADSQAVCEALISLIVLDLGRTLRDFAQRGMQRQGGLSSRALRLVRARLDGAGPAPSIDELARECGLSRHHFIRCFRHSTGIGPGAAIRQRRLDQAKAMLAESDRPIEQIARALGYAAPPAFSAAFRRATGRTPRAWRVLMR